MSDSSIDFRDTLLTLRDKISHAEHYWRQGNEEKAKESLQRLSNNSGEAAEHHFEDVETFYNDTKKLEDIVKQKNNEENN